MKKILLVVFVAILAMGSGFAQQGGGGDPAARLQRNIEGLTTALGLSADQVAKVTPILSEAQKAQIEAYAKMSAGGADVDRDKMREERTKSAAETDKKIKAVITAEQGVKLDAYRKKQADERAAQRNQNR